MRARIYLPAKNAMQSGRANTRHWVLEFEPEALRRLDPLMGWSGTADMNGEVILRFPTAEAAIAYAEGRRIPYEVEQPKPAARVIKAYADNFKFQKSR